MQYVLDTSVLVQGAIEDTDSARVATLLSLLNQTEPAVIHVPEFSLVECANVLWKQVQFFGSDSAEAEAALSNLLRLPLTVHTAASLLPRSLEIALTNHLAVYDCVHIALAENLSCPLITVDQRQMSIAQGEAVVLKSITDFPEFQSGT